MHFSNDESIYKPAAAVRDAWQFDHVSPYHIYDDDTAFEHWRSDYIPLQHAYEGDEGDGDGDRGIGPGEHTDQGLHKGWDVDNGHAHHQNGHDDHPGRGHHYGHVDNQAPLTTDASAITNEDSAISGSVVNSTTDANNDLLTFSLVGTAPAGLGFNTDGSWAFDPTGQFDYLAPGDSAQVVFQYLANDGIADSNTSTVTITVDGVNDAPMTVDGTATTNEDTPVSGTVVNNTSDPDNNPATDLTYSVVGTAPTGLSFSPDGSWTFDPTGLFDYLAPADSAQVAFQYQANDGLADSNVSTVAITVDGVNDAPVTTDVSVTTDEHTAVNGTVAPATSDADNPGSDLSYSVVGSAPTGLTFHSDGTWAFDPAGNFADLNTGDSAHVAFQYQANDGAADSNVSTVAITVEGVTDAPASPYLDIAYGQYNASNNWVANDGSGGFVNNGLPGSAVASWGVALGDVDHNGSLDIVFGNANAPNQLLLNDGNGHFVSSDLPGGAQNTQDISLGDFNGDGWLDAFVSNYNQPDQILINNGTGDGSFSASDIPDSSSSGYKIAVGDVNGDGWLDAVIGNNYATSQVLINNGTGDGSFTASSLPTGPDSHNGVALGDVDGDGDLDLVLANFGAQNQLLLNDGSGNFSAPINLDGGTMNSRGIALGDLNGDGYLDAFVINYFQPSQLLINDGSGNFTATSVPSPNTAPFANANAQDVTLADINADGSLDVVISQFQAFDLLLINDGSGNFTTTGAGGYQSITAAIGDLNGDGPVTPVDAHGLPNIDTAGLLPDMFVV